MARISGFRSSAARAEYHRLYDATLATSSVPVSESDVETSFGRTHVLRAGDPDKPALVALHGMAISSTSWVPLLPALTQSHCVTMLDAIDDPGKSVAARPTTRVEALVAWLDEALTELGLPRTAMVGLSRGGWMAANYAATFPERVERLALICPVGLAGGLRPAPLLRGLPTLTFLATAPRVRAFLESLAMPNTRPALYEPPWQPVFDQFVNGAMGFRQRLTNARPNPWPLQSACDVRSLARTPVLVLIGRQEVLLDGPRTAARLRTALPDARIELVDEASHLIFIDRQALVEAALRDFLRAAS